MSLKKILLKNGIASAFQNIIRVAEQLLLIPFFISNWGSEFYGEWITLTIIPSMLAFSDLGFGSATANLFVLRYASGNKSGAADSAKSGKVIISLTIIGGLLLGSIAIVLLNHYNVFTKTLIPQKDAIWAVSFLMIARLTNFYTQLFEAYYRAARKAALSTNMLAIYSATNLALSVFLLSMKAGIILFAAGNLIITILFVLIYSTLGERVLNLKSDFKGVLVRSDIKEITSKGFGYLLSPIWQSIFFQGTTFAVRMTLGPQAVAIFNTVRTVSRSVNQAFSMVNATIFPELQFELGAGHKEKARRLFRTALMIVMITAVAGMIFLIVGGPWLYEKWTRSTLHPPLAMWNIFVIGIAFNAMWWTAGAVFRAVNKPYGLAVMGVISAIISVISSYFLSKIYGLTGAALGSLILDILMAIYVLPVSCKLLDQPLSTLASSMWQDMMHNIHSVLKKVSEVHKSHKSFKIQE